MWIRISKLSVRFSNRSNNEELSKEKAMSFFCCVFGSRRECALKKPMSVALLRQHKAVCFGTLNAKRVIKPCKRYPSQVWKLESWLALNLLNLLKGKQTPWAVFKCVSAWFEASQSGLEKGPKSMMVVHLLASELGWSYVHRYPWGCLFFTKVKIKSGSLNQ